MKRSNRSIPQTGEENTVFIGVDWCVSNETERDRTRST